MSATSSEDVDRLQALMLHNAVVLSVAAPAGAAGAGAGSGTAAEIEHFRIDCHKCADSHFDLKRHFVRDYQDVSAGSFQVRVSFLLTSLCKEGRRVLGRQSKPLGGCRSLILYG